MAKRKSYVASTSINATRFHVASSSCGHIRRIPQDKLQKFRSFKAAIDAGKRPCTCVVPKPRAARKVTLQKTNLQPGVDVVKGPATKRTHSKSGAFAKGNPGGPGNPYLKEVKKERESFAVALRSLSPKHVFDVLWSMYLKATGPERNVAAANIFLNQTLGRPAVAITLKGDSGPLEKLMEIIRDGRNGKKPKKIDVDVIEKAKRDAERR